MIMFWQVGVTHFGLTHQAIQTQRDVSIMRFKGRIALVTVAVMVGLGTTACSAGAPATGNVGQKLNLADENVRSTAGATTQPTQASTSSSATQDRSRPKTTATARPTTKRAKPFSCDPRELAHAVAGICVNPKDFVTVDPHPGNKAIMPYVNNSMCSPPAMKSNDSATSMICLQQILRNVDGSRLSVTPLKNDCLAVKVSGTAEVDVKICPDASGQWSVLQH